MTGKQLIAFLPKEKMTDKQLIAFLWKLLEEDLINGHTPTELEYAILEKELKERKVIKKELFEGHW